MMLIPRDIVFSRLIPNYIKLVFLLFFFLLFDLEM